MALDPSIFAKTGVFSFFQLWRHPELFGHERLQISLQTSTPGIGLSLAKDSTSQDPSVVT